ncbi:neuromedin U receptor homolog nmur-2-like [Haliotis cracherodii]|uniref:neuromedin U receptor homolog nmur-2-like n=1 Tax=Haliotis cracherodii TaxID=6455 RepID=UPI0039E8F428
MSTSLLWPVLVFAVILFVLGFFGNCLVLYIYHRHMAPTMYGLFVKSLATLDLFSISVCLPSSFYFTFFTRSNDTPHMCKYITFMSNFTTVTSGILLSIIAVERYRKICRPLAPQITKSLVKKLFLGGIIVVLLLSVPVLFIVGVTHNKVYLGNTSVEFPGCGYQEKFKQNGQSLMFSILLNVGYLAIAAFMGVMYGLIGRVIHRHREQHKDQIPKKRISTKIFFILTIVYFFCVSPTMTLTLIYTLHPELDDLSLTKMTLLNLAWYCPYVNAVANPIIYSFTSKLFSAKCHQVLCCREVKGV